MSRGLDVNQTTDGGYILVDEVDYPTDAIRHYMKIIKTDSSGNLEWSNTLDECDISDD